MAIEHEVESLRARIVELEERVEFLYKRLGVAYSLDPNQIDSRIMDAIQHGNKIEAIKIYREIYEVGLAEAKQAIDNMENLWRR